MERKNDNLKYKLEKEIADLEAQMEKIQMLTHYGIISPLTFSQAKQLYESEYATLIERLEEIQ